MPQMPGPQLAERLLLERPGVRVLLMSGFAQPILDSGGHLEPGVDVDREAVLRAGAAREGRPDPRAGGLSAMPELLIVDDDEALRRWEERVVRDQGYSCDGARDADAGARAPACRSSYQLALLDVNMPGESGMELLCAHPPRPSRRGGADGHRRGPHRAGDVGDRARRLRLSVKPVGAGRAADQRRQRAAPPRREAENQRLRGAAGGRRARSAASSSRTTLQDLELSETKVWVSQAETIFRLARLVEFRDEETGHHLHRMSSYCELLAREVGFSEQRCELVRLASQLHDVGKVAVPDSILLKRGKLDPQEFEVIKGHAETGFQMLSGAASEVVQLGALIARTHHERWEGSGYPRGLAGEDIPPEGRIAAIADVFDALTSDRVYRPAFPVKSAIEMMREERGRHFDPELLDAFIGAMSEVEAIRHAYAD